MNPFKEIAVDKRRLVLATGIVVTCALTWLAMGYATDKDASETRPVEVYPLKNIEARMVADLLTRLFQGRDDIRFVASPSENKLTATAVKEDHKVLREFLILLDRPAKRALMFPENVERAMIGEGMMRDNRSWPQSR
jgi:hypothetical protein